MSEKKPAARHWLLEVAAAQGLPGAAAVTVGDAALSDVWLIVARACKLDPEELAAVVGRHFGVPTCGDVGRPDPAVARLVPEALARKLRAVPLKLDAGRLQVAVADPRDPEKGRQVARAARQRVDLRVAAPETIENWLLQAYAPQVAGRAAVFYQPGTSGWERTIGDEPNPVAQLTAQIFAEAVRHGATDVHLQPFLGGGIVRLRVDGLLRRSMSLSSAALRRVVTRIKAVSGMNVADPLHPHDGRARLDLGDRSIDLRVSTVPADGAEKMVVRLLGSGRLPVFSDLGFRDPERTQVRAVLTRREGIVFVTGPTGSGKTTTLQACLAQLNRPEFNIVTVENPVEYKVPGLSQIEVNPEAGLTYASALRAILRQDPNLILVGEVRDAETATIAVESALTGHPVLTTLHTPRAVGVVPRLVELGVPRTVLADAFGGATSQRLVRKLCAACAGTTTQSLTEAEKRFDRLTGFPFRRANGCAACGFTGFRGRVPVAQVVMPSRELRACILDASATEMDLERVVAEAGTRSLGQAAADVIRDGDTTPDEVERVLGGVFWSDLAEQARGRGVDVSMVAVAAPEPVEAHADRPCALVVGPRAEGRRELVLGLNTHGFDAIEADGADAAARALVGQALFAAVVLDVDAGAAAGTLLAGLKAFVGPMGLPVVAVTVNDDAPLRELAAAGRVDAVLSRPLASEAALAERVEAVIEARAASLDTGAAFLDFLDALPEN